MAHNRRVGGVTRAEVLLNLGREDELDIEGLDIEGLRPPRRSMASACVGVLLIAGSSAGRQSYHSEVRRGISCWAD